MIKGNNLYITTIEPKDMSYLYKWFRDEEFLKFYDYLPPIPQSKSEVNKTIEEYETNDQSIIFAVKTLDDNEIIGITGYIDIVKENKVATLFIGIGNKDNRGKGLGTEVLNLLLNYGFHNMGLYRIQLNVLEFNDKAIRLYERAGFVKEGIYRKFVLRDGERYDLLLYGLLRDEHRDVVYH